jgi:hypothetical protein
MAQSDKAKRNFEDIQKSVQETEKFIKEISKEFPDIINYSKRLVQTFSDYKKLSDSQLNTLKKSNDLQQQILGNRRNINKETFETVDLDELSAEFSKQGLKNRKAILQVLKHEQRIQKSINSQINASANAAKSFGDNISSAVSGIPVIGGFLSTALGIDSLGQDMADAVREAFKPENFWRGAGQEAVGGFISNMFRANPQSKKEIAAEVASAIEKAGGNVDMSGFQFAFADENGGLSSLVDSLIGKGERDATVRLVESFGGGKWKTAWKVAGALGAVALFKGLQDGISKLPFQDISKQFIPGFRDFVEVFGDISQFSFSISKNLSLNAILFGIQKKEALELAKIQSSISGLSIDQSLATQRDIAGQAKRAGVLPADIIKDMADNSQLIAEFTNDGGKNMAQTAIQARKLGMSLGTTAKIANSLLDFESSIENELEASLLIGRQLNLNRARELALAGDMEALQKEIVKQVGSEQQLQNMNVVARRSLAQSLGIEVSELNRLAQGNVKFKAEGIDKNNILMTILNATLLTLITALAFNTYALLKNIRGFFRAHRAQQGSNVLPFTPGGGGVPKNFKNFNEFRKANAGRGMNMTQMGKAYQIQKAMQNSPRAMSAMRYARVGGLLAGAPNMIGGIMSGDMGQVATGVGTSAGAWGGAKLGAAIGTAIAPGIGTAIGGIVGSLGGAALGLFATDKLVNKQEEGNNGIVSELQALRREQKQGFSELAGNV